MKLRLSTNTPEGSHSYNVELDTKGSTKFRIPMKMNNEHPIVVSIEVTPKGVIKALDISKDWKGILT